MSQAVYYICDGCGNAAVGVSRPSPDDGPDLGPAWVAPQGWQQLEVGREKKHACTQACVTKIVMGKGSDGNRHE